MTSTAAMSGVEFTLQAAQTTGNGTAINVPSTFKYHKIIINAASGVTAGAVQPEGADSDSYSGTWAPIGGGPVTVVGGGQVEVNFEGTYQAIRGRITTNISGGGAPSVTVSYYGSRL